MAPIKLYVGNLPWSGTSDDLGQKFSEAGTVVSAQVVTDRYSGRSRGFGFVEMESQEMADKAIEMFNGKDFNGREIVVNVARPREEGAGTGGQGMTPPPAAPADAPADAPVVADPAVVEPAKKEVVEPAEKEVVEPAEKEVEVELPALEEEKKPAK